MTPSQMLARIARNRGSQETTPLRQIPRTCAHCGLYGTHDDDCKHANLGATAPTGKQVRLTISGVEPWLLEQLEELSCPTCGKGMMILHNEQHKVKFYTCTDDPLDHRWALYYER